MAELKPVYLISGSDRPKIVRALRRLRTRVDDEAVELLAASETSGEEAVAACNALGLFGGSGRLIVVEEVERWKAADAKAVAAYLASPAPETVLALVGGEVKRDSALYKACAKVGDVLTYDAPRRDLSRWVAEGFARLGATADGEACRTLVALVGADLEALTSETEKVAAWAAGEPIGEREVELLVAASAETSVFTLTDAWGRRDVRATLAACEALLERSGEPRARVLPRLVALLANHVGRVQACRALDAEGVRPREAAGALKLHPFAAEKAFAQSRNFSAEELRDAIVRLARLDLALKGQSRLAGDLELELALVEITRGRTSASAA